MNWKTDVSHEFPDYLRDESRRIGKAEAIAFPVSEDELVEAVRDAHGRGLPMTIQGARTGLAAGAVPEEGAILNLSRLNRVTGLAQRDGTFFLRVQPGVLLSELRAGLAARSFDTAGWDDPSKAALAALRAAGPQIVTADPTESSASIGGMAACNSSGARSFRYGAVRSYVEALRVVLADGTAVELRRGVHKAQGRAFELALPDGRVLAGRVPDYRMPAVKNAAGYFAADDMDLVDLFVGSEGTLGVISLVELRLAPEPAVVWGMTVFLPSREMVCKFVRMARGKSAGREVVLCRGAACGVPSVTVASPDAIGTPQAAPLQNAAIASVPTVTVAPPDAIGTPASGAPTTMHGTIGTPASGAPTTEQGTIGTPASGAPTTEQGTIGTPQAAPLQNIAAIEYFDDKALALLRAQKAVNPAFAAIPDIPQGFAGAVYVELHAADEDAAGEQLGRLTEALAACGGSEDAAWLADTEQELQRLNVFRHAVPEAVNLLIGDRKKSEPELTKLGTDMAVPDSGLEAVLAMYGADLERLGLESVTFGHIGNNHVHVNILPRNMADYEAGKALYQDWARKVCAMGGTISAEHGVGKLKRLLLAVMYGEDGIGQMRAVKRVFDPANLLVRGNLF